MIGFNAIVQTGIDFRAALSTALVALGPGLAGPAHADAIANAAPGFATTWWTPPAPDVALQFTDSLSPTNWVNAPSGTNNPVAVPATVTARFYRLFKP